MPQKQLSKEFLRQWLISNDFQGLEGQIIPEMNDKYVDSVSERYIELYEKITGSKFKKLEICGKLIIPQLHFLLNFLVDQHQVLYELLCDNLIIAEELC